MIYWIYSVFPSSRQKVNYRPANNFWPMNPIFMKLSQVIYFINPCKFAKFQIILMLETDFTDQYLKTISGL